MSWAHASHEFPNSFYDQNLNGIYFVVTDHKHARCRAVACTISQGLLFRDISSLLPTVPWPKSCGPKSVGQEKWFYLKEKGSEELLNNNPISSTFLASTSLSVKGSWWKFLGLIPRLGRTPGGGHGNLLQYSCLENPRGQRGTWWATVHKVGKSQTRLSKDTAQKSSGLFICRLGMIQQAAWHGVWKPCGVNQQVQGLVRTQFSVNDGSHPFPMIVKYQTGCLYQHGVRTSH